MFASNSISIQFQRGLITLEQMRLENEKINGYVPVFFVFYIVFIAICSTWLRVAQIEYERDQALFDMLQGPVRLSDTDRYEYLIKTKSDSERKITITPDKLNDIERSEAFQSILTSLQTNIDGFNIDHSKVLKKIDKIFVSQKEENDTKIETGAQLSDSFCITENDDTLILEQTKKKLVDFLMKFKKLNAKKASLYFRIVDEIENLDFPDNIQYFKKPNDRLDDLRAIFFLSTTTGRFEERLHPVENINIRKAYVDWTLVEFILPGVAFFVDAPLVSNITVSEHSINQAKIMSLTYLTHLTIQKDSELRDEIANLKIELEDKKREISEKWDKIIERLIDTSDLERKLRSKITFKPINLTAIVLSILTSIIGFFVGLVIIGGGVTNGQ